MTLSIGAAIGSVVLDAITGISYCVKLIRGRTRPRLATWLIFEIGVAMSLATYFTARDHSVVKAALNLTDAVTVTVIIAALLLVGRHTRLCFTKNEQLSLVLSCAALAVWMFTRSAWAGFVGFQVVMSVAYIPTIESLWHRRTGPPPESTLTWSLNAVAALLGIIADISGAHHDYLAMLYPLRAFVLCMMVVVLVARWKRGEVTGL